LKNDLVIKGESDYRFPFIFLQEDKDMKYIIGVGNYTQCDDSIGVRVIEYIQEKNLGVGFEPLDLSAYSLNLFSYLTEDTEKMIIVDSAKMGLKPGEYKFFSPEEVETKKEVGSISAHEGDMLRVIELAKNTGYPIPPIEFLGIEPKTFEGGMDLSPELSEMLPTYVEEAIKRIKS
jgi:hydrogenase maturation protease